LILIIDNYDSFTYNLVQYVGALGYAPLIRRNDQITIEEIKLLQPDKIIISPGPGHPNDSGICLELITSFAGKLPILGVCLGHQSIGYAYGCKVIKSDTFMHGKTSQVFHNESDIFKGLPSPFEATRYHSLIVDKESIVNDLEVTAWTSDNIVMGCRHKQLSMLFGVQFHPESILTQNGQLIIKNFLELDMTC